MSCALDHTSFLLFSSSSSSHVFSLILFLLFSVFLPLMMYSANDSWSVYSSPLLFSFLSGLSTVFGAVLVISLPFPLDSRHLSFSVGLGIAVMMYVAFIDFLMPPIMASSPDSSYSPLFILLFVCGFLFLYFLFSLLSDSFLLNFSSKMKLIKKRRN